MRRQRQAIATIDQAAEGVALRSAPAGTQMLLWIDIDESPAAEARSGLLSQETVSLYVGVYERDEAMPPPRVWRDDDGTLRLGDGRHRWHAHIRAFGENTPLVCEVREGGYRDAFLDAAGSNISHGLPATQDQRIANLRRLAEDDEWSTWSARAMARQVGLSPTTVTKYLEQWQIERERVQYVDRHGNTSTMDTSGQRAAAQERQERMRQERQERRDALRGAPAGGTSTFVGKPAKSAAQPASATTLALYVSSACIAKYGDDDAASLDWLGSLQDDPVAAAVESAPWVAALIADGFEVPSMERWAIAIAEVCAGISAKLAGDGAPAADGSAALSAQHGEYIAQLLTSRLVAFELGLAIGRPELADAVDAAVSALLAAAEEWRS